MNLIAPSILAADFARLGDECRDVIEKGGFGWKCYSDSVADFTATVDKAVKADFEALGRQSYEYLENNYTVDKSYEIIKAQVEGSLEKVGV